MQILSIDEAVTGHVMTPRDMPTRSITIQRRGGHYNGVVSTSKKADLIVRFSTITADPKQDNTLPAPWSLDPYPNSTSSPTPF